MSDFSGGYCCLAKGWITAFGFDTHQGAVWSEVDSK